MTSPSPRDEALEEAFPITLRDYIALLDSAACDDSLVFCDTCGAWMEHDDPARASTDDYTGCWYMAAGGRERDKHLCRSYRSPGVAKLVDAEGLNPVLNCEFDSHRPDQPPCNGHCGRQSLCRTWRDFRSLNSKPEQENEK